MNKYFARPAPAGKAPLNWQASYNFFSLKTDSKSATIQLRDSHIAVINRHNVGLVAIEAHLVSSRSKKDGQDYIHLGPSKTRETLLAVPHKQEIILVGR